MREFQHTRVIQGSVRAKSYRCRSIEGRLFRWKKCSRVCDLLHVLLVGPNLNCFRHSGLPLLSNIMLTIVQAIGRIITRGPHHVECDPTRSHSRSTEFYHETKSQPSRPRPERLQCYKRICQDTPRSAEQPLQEPVSTLRRGFERISDAPRDDAYPSHFPVHSAAATSVRPSMSLCPSSCHAPNAEPSAPSSLTSTFVAVNRVTDGPFTYHRILPPGLARILHLFFAKCHPYQWLQVYPVMVGRCTPLPC